MFILLKCFIDRVQRWVLSNREKTWHEGIALLAPLRLKNRVGAAAAIEPNVF